MLAIKYIFRSCHLHYCKFLLVMYRSVQRTCRKGHLKFCKVLTKSFSVEDSLLLLLLRIWYEFYVLISPCRVYTCIKIIPDV